MYHAALLVLFLAASTHKPTRCVWLCLSAVTASDMLARHLYEQSDYLLYIVRSASVFAGAAFLATLKSSIARWNLFIYIATLLAYLALAVDVAVGAYSIFYEEIYEAVIYGLVGCQLVGIFPTLWACYRDCNSGRSFSLADLHWSKAR